MGAEKKPFEDDCRKLAEIVLADEFVFYSQVDRNDLAAEIQNTLENWVNRRNSEHEPHGNIPGET
jgi:hypothetical protein